MPASKGLTKGLPLRMTDEERDLVDQLQASYAAAGVTASLNDVLRHLIRRTEIPLPKTTAEGHAMINAHWATCRDCEAHRPPRCLDGLYLRELNRDRSSSGGSGAL